MPQRGISENDYSNIRSQFKGTILPLLDLMYYGFDHKKTSATLSDSKLKLEIISYVENVLQNITTDGKVAPSDEMIDRILSVKIPTNAMIVYNRKMKNAIFEMIIRQILGILKSNQSNKIHANEQKKENKVNVVR